MFADLGTRKRGQEKKKVRVRRRGEAVESFGGAALTHGELGGRGVVW